MISHPSRLCITPPHILRQIAQNGTPAQQAVALRTITTSEQIRALRRTVAELAPFMPVMAAAGKRRTVYDAREGSLLPGVVARLEEDPPSADPAVNEAFDGAGGTYDLYYDVYGRNSIDNNSLRLDSSVHYLKGYDNAFWNGEQMIYGDGDEDLPPAERLFNRFTIAVDVIGHELTHGVTQFEANLAYWDQPGALNESFSDVFGILVKQYQRQQTAAEADWIIGAGLFTANVNGQGLRSMKAPGTAYNDPVLGRDPQPAHIKDYVRIVEDNGGVHINSGIPNHAFYVTSAEIGGYAWEKAGRIWYKCLIEKLRERSNFQDAANLTSQAAGELFGAGSLEEQAVKTGWAEVGIMVGAPSGLPDASGSPQGSGCLSAGLRTLGLMRIPRRS
jgi:Zn-dependent metalloprotease